MSAVEDCVDVGASDRIEGGRTACVAAVNVDHAKSGLSEDLNLFLWELDAADLLAEPGHQHEHRLVRATVDVVVDLDLVIAGERHAAASQS